MARIRNDGHVDPAIPPYLTADEQLFVTMYLMTSGDLAEIARSWPGFVTMCVMTSGDSAEMARGWSDWVTAEDCERMAANPRIKAECEYRMRLPDEFLQGKTVEPRPGHDPFLEIEYIATAYSQAAAHKRNRQLAALNAAKEH